MGHSKLLATGLAAAVTLSAAGAAAQTMGRKSDVVIGADRLFGLYFTRISQERGNGRDTKTDWTEIGLGWGIPTEIPHTTPRLAVDFFVIDQLSVGGAVAFATIDDDDEEDDGVNAFLFAPRVGYLFGLSDVFAFWPRGGFTYHSYGDNADEDGLALTLEALFAVTPIDHFGFGFGPVLDLGITGESNNRDRTYRLFGITAGLFGWI